MDIPAVGASFTHGGRADELRSLQYLINHVFLPPETPQEDDMDIEYELYLISSLLLSVREFAKSFSTAEAQDLNRVIRMLEQLEKTTPGLQSSDKRAVMQNVIADLKSGECALFHLRAQNAGLLLTSRHDDILVEAFELLAPNREVMSTPGRLVREFPDSAATIKRDVLHHIDFLQEFSNMLSHLEREECSIARPKSRKSAVDFDEERETISPVLVTDMLLGTLAGIGQGVEPQRVSKRSREQVNWDHTRLPFHRSPTWLLLRVALRLVLDRQDPSPPGGRDSLYKALIAFYHCRLLKKAVQAGLNSELRFLMGAKLARRIVKLDPSVDAPWLQDARQVIETNHRDLQLRWQQAQTRDTAVRTHQITELCFQSDSNLRLEGLGRHLLWIQSRSMANRFAGHGDKTLFSRFPASDLPSLAKPQTTSTDFLLLEFEAWIELNLASWVSVRSRSNEDYNFARAEEDLGRLQTVVGQYHTMASSSYTENPEALSLMYLNIMELWVALDKLAGNFIPLLLDYDPGFTSDLVRPLILPTQRQMVRLAEIETYLFKRYRTAQGRYTHFFEEVGGRDSFAVRYFDSSVDHQALYHEIEDNATKRWDNKLQQYRRLLEKYEEMTNRRASFEHEKTRVTSFGRAVCEPYCKACQLDTAISHMKIGVFEWPLPNNSNLSKTIVFEISVPKAVAIWRDTTTSLFLDVFPWRKSQRATPLWRAAEHSGVKSSTTRTSQVELASNIKPVEASHYRSKHISMVRSETDLCIRYPWFSYDYWDTNLGVPWGEVFRKARVPARCSHAKDQLGPQLKTWTRSTTHTSNEVIAAQSVYPQTMSLDEFRAFGHLRSGVCLQWANILCQLTSPSLNWNQESTYLLVLQACLEAGPSDSEGSVFRQAHSDLRNDGFVGGMVVALNDTLARLRGNWQNDIAISLVVCLAIRLLSLTDSTTNSDSLLGFLSMVRGVTLQWAKQLLEKTTSSGSDEDPKELDHRIVMAALVCMSTFDVEMNLLDGLLDSPDNLCAFVEAAVLIENHISTAANASTPIMRLLLHRWRGIMHRSSVLVKGQVIDKRNSGFHTAIQFFWADYSPSATDWFALTRNHRGHILQSRMAIGNGESILVTFNMLEGRLLVDGYPLSRLPEEYVSHPSYVRLFGTQVLQVMPSTLEGMRFSAYRDQHGWTVHFAIVNSELVIKAVQSQTTTSGAVATTPDIYEFIPPSRLAGDVPTSFIKNYCHWFNNSGRKVEFRPADDPWATSSKSWTMMGEKGCNMLKRDGCYLIDPQSSTATALSSVLSPIESKENMDIIFHPDARVVVLDLPRLALSFTLTEGETKIKSKNYSGMCVDQSQNIGSLVGLQTKLVLRQEGVSQPSTPMRIVLVPRGPLSSARGCDHIRVAIQPSDAAHIKHDAFTIDTGLGQILTSGALSSRLYLCHLHALTSHFLPDPLTGRTGTEEALRILASASVRSFQRLDAESCSFLRNIAQIAPRRNFYPDHLQNMEQVVWSKTLPTLSQYDGFLSAVESILDHARECEKLHETGGENGNSLDLTAIEWSAESLVQRALIRNATFRVSEFGAEHHTTGNDAKYLGRHRRQQERTPQDFTRAKIMARCVVSQCQQLVDQPSPHLRDVILDITGERFLRRPKVDLSFNLRYLEPTSLAGMWCGLHLSLTEEPNRYKIAFLLSGLVYSRDVNWDILQALMAFANIRTKFSAMITPPAVEAFNLSHETLVLSRITADIVKQHMRPYSASPECNIPKMAGETKKESRRRRQRIWEARSKKFILDFIDELRAQWEQGSPITTPAGEDYRGYMDVDGIMPKVIHAVDLARGTALFHQYLDDLVEELGQISVLSGQEFDHDTPMMDVCSFDSERKQESVQLGFVRSSALFSRPAPLTVRPQPVDFSHLCQLSVQNTGDIGPLTRLLDQLAQLSGRLPYQVSYVNELRCSSGSTVAPRHRLKEGSIDLQSLFNEHLIERQKETKELRDLIDKALGGHSIAEQLCQAAGMYPRVSPVFLLQRLALAFWPGIPAGWRACLVNYGLSLVYLQRAERLVKHSTRPDRTSDLLKELLNTGSHSFDEGNPLKDPENLLLEVEQGILIRPVQQRIATKMRNPPGQENSVMQLNMGEGKSSVIVPVVSAALANGRHLVRVVVAKPQSKQMMHTLIGTLGGLINRRIFYLPISRAVRPTESYIRAVQHILKACRSQAGVLLVQPEHLLSFKLMGLENTWADATRADGLMGQVLNTHCRFENVSRDIVDESDENFSVRFELIYTMGSQQPVGMSPDRWAIIQALLDIVVKVAKHLTSRADIEIAKGLLFEDDEVSGRFPTIRILEEKAGKHLVAGVAKQLCRGGLTGFPIQHQSKRMKKAVFNYMLDSDLSSQGAAEVENASSGFFKEATTKNVLLLLRGLLAAGVISFALGQNRFRVNYGLAPDRQPPTLLAVPYRAKDSPSPRSEFSHPDVVIVLTCLSYYYQGLSNDELYICLEKVGESDQAEQEYARWAGASPQLEPSLRHVSGVNLKDRALCKDRIFPALRYTKPAIDFYLANVVFPKEMREFPFKLSASGWDLGKAKRYPLTGFSGTTDSKYVLPLSVKALDLPEQRHTNSAVLACILRDENNVLELGEKQGALSALTVDMLLSAVTASSQPMRVILDVGAQIIELSNLQVAQRWLGLVPSQEVDAVIFFNEQDELSVLTRNGMIDFFLTSPFAAQTDRCLVFLDQAHTRGTDLKLPDTYRAAVTLGPGVTKDTLVQACMRMRKLGDGQAVTFCVSPEMQTRIRSLAKINASRPLTVTDVLVCAIVETWEDANRSVPLWATQGIRHQRQEAIWARAEQAGKFLVKDVQDYLEAEAQSLEQRYRPVTDTNGASASQSLASTLNAALKLETRQEQLAQIRDKCFEFGIRNLDSTGPLQEEQERELAPEIQQERHIERPHSKEPASHFLDEDLERFALTGVLRTPSPAFIPAFAALSNSSASKLFPVTEFPSDLLATADFAYTIKSDPASHSSTDTFQRPVQWVLTQAVSKSEARHGMHVVIISPWEANQLKSRLESAAPDSCHPPVLLRAYLPRSSLSFRTLEDLSTYTFPASSTPPPPPPRELVTQLNLFAGQLYLRSYAEYVRLCRYLGLSYRENDGDADIAADGFVGKNGGPGYEGCRFEMSPVSFLAVLYKRIRRDCLDIEKTHMGRILAGEILREGDFETGCVDTEEGIEGERFEGDEEDLEEGELRMDVGC